MQFPITFPKDFLFGAATSAHQVEGGNIHSDWWEWELRTAKRKAQSATLRQAQDKKRWPEYILEKYPNPLQEENYISGTACDHYNRFREDFALARELGHNAHRFSIEWARVEPEEGRFDEKEIAHYREVLMTLKNIGLVSFVSLHHFVNPLWFAKKGGWENPHAPEMFAHYAKKIAETLGSSVDFWITLNEPWNLISSAYLFGRWPPQKHNPFAAQRAFRNIVTAHHEAYEAVKSILSTAKISLALNNVYFEPGHPWFLPDRFVVGALKKFYNFSILNKLLPKLDFIAVNYYSHGRVSLLPPWYMNENNVVMDFSWWEVYPRGIYYVLKDLAQFRLPIFVTENGVADVRDTIRPRAIVEHLWWLHKAIEDGVDVRGYLHWSLLDNFEWDKGFWPRFGLVEIDYKTQQRTPRKSAYLFRDIIRNNAITEETVRQYAPDLLPFRVNVV